MIKTKRIELKSITTFNEEPRVDIGPHCKKPHSCVYLDRCWPENMNDIDSVFRLYRLNLKKKLNFYNKGIDKFEKVKDISSLTSTQQNQLKAYKTKTPVIDKRKLADFISKVEYPITFFDFDTLAKFFNLSSGTGTTPTLGSIVQKGKFAACALLEFVKALNKVDLPTLGSPTIPHLKLIIYYLLC